MSTGVELISKERTRQVNQEGWSPEHDDEHDRGELARAAACYAVASAFDVKDVGLVAIQKILVALWPPTWAVKWWKPKDRKSNLVRAGALIAAELDRLLREEAKEQAAAAAALDPGAERGDLPKVSP